ncbi:phage holin family protein [Enterococcus faecalis]|uniref:phage holin family protein n=1 Tax=Enterococcus faecalis TaxID=1351 RepID=UPI0015585021|nr:phage holin family protein [Enterococcus faecalis]
MNLYKHTDKESSMDKIQELIIHMGLESNHMFILAMICCAMICCAMIIDFLSGVFAAKMNPKIDFQSRIGINGILKKIAALMLLIFFIPLAMTIPGNTGTGLLYVLYFGYLLMEIQSILENYQKIGIDVSLFQNFINRYSKSTMDNNKTNNSNEKEKKEEK